MGARGSGADGDAGGRLDYPIRRGVGQPRSARSSAGLRVSAMKSIVISAVLGATAVPARARRAPDPYRQVFVLREVGTTSGPGGRAARKRNSQQQPRQIGARRACPDLPCCLSKRPHESVRRRRY